jgi:regulator of protease activity HflC (stomatin/prohibitin superfamily)
MQLGFIVVGVITLFFIGLMVGSVLAMAGVFDIEEKEKGDKEKNKDAKTLGMGGLLFGLGWFVMLALLARRMRTVSAKYSETEGGSTRQSDI